MVRFKWFGQACFEVSNSKKIVTDPHDGETVGLNAPKAKADIVTVSHDHFDHASGVGIAKKQGAKVLKEEKGEKTVKGVKIKGIKSYHDKAKGSKRGENTIYTFELDGFKICHLGDLGHIVSSELIEEIGEIDILMIPIGGNYTIDGGEAIEVVEKINPKVIIPMHYKIDGLTVDISSEEQFMGIAKGKGWNIEEKEELVLKSLPKSNTVVKLKYVG